MEWLIVGMLILIGAILVLLEILVIPGVGITGVLGFACVIAGIYFGYAYYGSATGHLILLGTVILGFAVTWYVMRTKTWKKLSLHTQIDSAVEGIDSSIRVGDCGVTLGRLAPMGNVRIGEVVVEAESRSGYIDAQCPVEVIKVLKNKVIVQLKTV